MDAAHAELGVGFQAPPAVLAHEWGELTIADRSQQPLVRRFVKGDAPLFHARATGGTGLNARWFDVIVNISEDVAADVRASTDAETPEEIAAVLEDLWVALENSPRVVERHREHQVVAK